MKLLLGQAQLELLLSQGRINLQPAYIDKGSMYYSHVCPYPEAIAEFNCTEPFLVHDKPYIDAGPWLSAIHVVHVPKDTTFHPTFVYPDLDTLKAHDMRDVVNAVHRAIARPVRRDVSGLQSLSAAFLQGCTAEELPTFRDVFTSFIELNPKFIRMAWYANDIPNADKFKTLAMQLPSSDTGLLPSVCDHIYKKWTLFS